MTWTNVGLCLSEVCGIYLVTHLIRLRLGHVYLVFALSVLFGLIVPPTVAFIEVTHVDYRNFYIAMSGVDSILTLWMVYSLLNAILGELPGILRFSRYLLHGVFLLATAVSIFFARLTVNSAHLHSFLTVQSWVVLTLAYERVITTIAITALIAILAFVLWFPVELPRNLLYFSATFTVYFCIETAVLVLAGLVHGRTLDALSAVRIVVLCGSYIFLTLKLTREGQRVRVRAGHGWEKAEQNELVHKLETLNEALLKGARQF